MAKRTGAQLDSSKPMKRTRLVLSRIRPVAPVVPSLAIGAFTALWFLATSLYLFHHPVHGVRQESAREGSAYQSCGIFRVRRAAR
jgi:hypothetical protein